MFAGHVGVSLAIGRVERSVNAGLFVLAGMALDGILWLLILLGRETVTIPTNYRDTHLAAFEMPFSHGLLAAGLWSALAGAMAGALARRGVATRWRIAMLIAGTVFSHWLLDALVHTPELPLLGATSTRVGLGLWQHMPLALGIESALALAGLWLYLRGSGLVARRSWGLAILVMMVLASTIAGMSVAPAPPSAALMAVSSLVTIAVVAAATGWITAGGGSARHA
jgi:hypothetical protein